jgi:hypothetical protein
MQESILESGPEQRIGQMGDADGILVRRRTLWILDPRWSQVARIDAR